MFDSFILRIGLPTPRLNSQEANAGIPNGPNDIVRAINGRIRYDEDLQLVCRIIEREGLANLVSDAERLIARRDKHAKRGAVARFNLPLTNHACDQPEQQRIA